jgi:hypothetical protein
MICPANPGLVLGTITAKGGTGVTVKSAFLKMRSVTETGSTVVDLTDPQGLQQLERVLQGIVTKFNNFHQNLNFYKEVYADQDIEKLKYYKHEFKK